MTESSQQEFFLDHFQKVRDVLEGGDVRKALGIMLDVRENGFVNKELDTMIDSLRDDPPKEVVDEALRWSTMIIDRLTSFGGDVFQLVEEFSEASLGLSEAEWVPVDEEEQNSSSDAGELESMEFDSIDDMDFDLDLDDVGSRELEMDLDFSDDGEDEDQWDDLDALDELSELGELSDLDELSELQESSEDANASLEESSSSVDFAVVDGSSPSEAESDAPEELIRQDQETKPHQSVADEDRETKPHQAASRDNGPGNNSLRETAKQPVAEQTSAKEQAAKDEVDGLFDGFDFDDSEPFEEEPSAQGESSHSFVDEATRRSDSLDEMLALTAGGKGKEDSEESSPEPFQHSGSEADDEEADDDFDFDLGFENPESRVETPSPQSESDDDEIEAVEKEDEEIEEADDDFDFDLGFENPASRVETPDFASPSSEPADDVEDAEEAEEGDDFDFDLGFENPNARNQTPTGPPAPESDSAEEPAADEDDDFDFDLGFENPESKTSTPGRLGAGDVSDSSEFEHDLDFDKGRLAADGGDSSGQGSGSGARRDPEATPASMPSIPRFKPPTDEETSPRDGSSDEGGDSLDDDEFFELAESLTGESSEESSQQGPYRGEPLMNSSNTPVPTSMPTPTPVPAPESELSEVSQGRERADTPNPFAHEAPTGVQRALVDSNSSFVLEEIRDSEVSEAQEDEAAVGALMSEARRLYEKGKFESAHDLLDAVIARDDANDDAQDLMGAVEGELERQHQAELGSLSKVPELKVKMSDIPNMNLDHRFGYLLSQIDGMSTFEDILELSSMTRLETLEVLAQMLERDIISVS